MTRVRVFSVRITCENATVQTSEDIAAVLKVIVDDMNKTKKDYGIIRDLDGNKIGSYGLRHENID